MRRGNDAAEEVKRRTDLVRVISGYVKLRKQGQRLLGLCPFHPEKTPSFTVNPEKQFWHCFGCNTGGDVFAFVQKIDNLDFRGALEKLAAQCGVELVKETPAQRDRRQRERQLLEDAALFFQRELGRSRRARDYLQGRGIAGSVAERFRLGYAPDSWDSLRNHLASRGATDEEMLAVGLVRRSQQGSSCYDLFRDRVIFPICDENGRVVAFGGRAFGDAQPKYLNSPESEHFSKSRTVYALHLAREEIRARGEALLMEGYMDVLAAHQHGFTHAVATLGTAMTPEHLRTLRRYTEAAVMVYDADNAGSNATLRSLPLLEAAGLRARVVVLPQGQDPDSLLREQGPEALADCLDAALPFVDYQMQFLLTRYGLREESGRRQVWNGAVTILSQVRDPVERDRWRRRIAELWAGEQLDRVSLIEAELLSAVNRKRRSDERSLANGHVPEAPQPPPSAASPTEGLLAKLETAALRACLEDPGVAARVLEAVPPERFSSPDRQALAALLSRRLEEGRWDEDLSAEAGEELQPLLSRLLASPEPVPEGEGLEKCLERLAFEWGRRRLQVLRQRLMEGETPSAEELQSMYRLARQLRT